MNPIIDSDLHSSSDSPSSSPSSSQPHTSPVALPPSASPPLPRSRPLPDYIRQEKEEMERQYAELLAENEKLKRLIQSDLFQKTTESPKENWTETRKIPPNTHTPELISQPVSKDLKKSPSPESENENEEMNEGIYIDDEGTDEESEDLNVPQYSSLYNRASGVPNRNRFDSDMDDSSHHTDPPKNPFVPKIDIVQRPTSASHFEGGNSKKEKVSKSDAFVVPRPSTALPTKPQQSSGVMSLPNLLWKGGILWKIPFNGRGLPERRIVMIKRASRPSSKSKPVIIMGPELLFSDGSHSSGTGSGYIYYPPTIIWANPERPDDLSNARELVIGTGTHIVEGHQSSAFWKTQSRGTPLPAPQFCFSIVTSTRSLDLAAESVQEAASWKNAIHALLIMLSPNTDWAIENLHRTKPTWRHDSLDNPPPARRKGSLPFQDPTLSKQDGIAQSAYDQAALSTGRSATSSVKDQMFAATRAGDYDTLSQILKTKISVNLMSGELKDTPLMIACRYGMDDIARLCLNYGARNDPHPDFGQTALHCAVESKSFGCARVLLDAAAPSGSDSFIANLKDTNGKSSLHVACKVGEMGICKLLVSHGADIALRDGNMRTALHICSYFGHKSLLSYLLDSGGDGYLELTDSDGRTALHYAAECGHLSCVKLLLETAANPLSTDSNKQTPYHVAYRAGQHRICELLLEYQRHSVPDSVYEHPQVPIPRNNGWVGEHNQRISDPTLKNLSLRSTQHNQSPALFAPTIIRGTSTPTLIPSPLGFEALPRPHTSRPSSAVNSTPISTHLSSPSRHSKENFQFENDFAPYSLSSHDLPSELSIESPRSDFNLIVSFYFDGRNRHSSQNNWSNVYDSPKISRKQHDPNTSLETLNSIDGSTLPRPTRTRSISTNAQNIQSLSLVEPQSSTTSIDSTSSSLEHFIFAEGDWDVYRTAEGYVYYLDSKTQHSQWEDPRLHGILVYDERTGGYVKCLRLPQLNTLPRSPQVTSPTIQDETKQQHSLRSHKNKSKPQKVHSLLSPSEDDSEPEEIPSVFVPRHSSPGSTNKLRAIPQKNPQSEIDVDLESVSETTKERPHQSLGSSLLNQSDQSDGEDNTLEIPSETLRIIPSKTKPAVSINKNTEELLTPTPLKKLILETENENDLPTLDDVVKSQLNPDGFFASEPDSNGVFEEDLPILGDIVRQIEVSKPNEGSSDDAVSSLRSQSPESDPVSLESYYRGTRRSVENPSSVSLINTFATSILQPQALLSELPQIDDITRGGQLPSITRIESKSPSVDGSKECEPEENIPVLGSIHRSNAAQDAPMNPELVIDLDEDDEEIETTLHTRKDSADLSEWDEAKSPEIDANHPDEIDDHNPHLPEISLKNQSANNFEISEDFEYQFPVAIIPPKTQPLVSPALPKRILTDEELKREKIFASELGGYGNGGSLYDPSDSSIDTPTALVAVRKVTEILVNYFKFCSHSDLLITAVQKLDRMGGKINSTNLSALLESLPSENKLSEILFAIRSPFSPEASHPYQPGELLCQSVSKFYPLFLLELQGFILLLHLTPKLSILLQFAKRIVDSCNQILSNEPLRKLIQKIFAVGSVLCSEDGTTSDLSLEILQKFLHSKATHIPLLEYIARGSGSGGGFVSPIFDDDFFDVSIPQFLSSDISWNFQRMFSEMTSYYVGLTEIIQQLTSRSQSHSKVLEYLNQMRTEMKSIEKEIEDMKRIETLLKKKIELVMELFGEQENDLITLQDVLSFLKELNDEYQRIIV